MDGPPAPRDPDYGNYGSVYSAMEPYFAFLRRTPTTTTMSQARQTYTYLAFMPDYTDEDAFERRLAVRPKHLENSKLVRERGLLKLGGPLISPDTYRSEQKKLIGSAGLYEAESIEEIRKVIEEDIYYTSGVWDKEKIVILPWSAALPIPIVQD